MHNNFSPLSILADPDTYELKNKPRQYTEWGSKGEYKAENLARRLAASFPFEPYFYNTSGVERQNVDIILSNLTKYVEAINLKLINEGLNPIEGLVIDAVDVTSQSGWENKFLLHQAAYMNNIDVINALDIGNRSVVTYYDYSKNPNLLPLDGKVSANEVIGKDALPHFDLNTRIIPNIFGIPNVDYEYAEEYVQRAHKIKAIMESGDEASIPGVRQEKIASDLFAARVPYMLKKLLLGEKLQKEFSIHADNKELTTYNFIRVAGLFIRNYRLLKVTAAYEHQMG